MFIILASHFHSQDVSISKHPSGLSYSLQQVSPARLVQTNFSSLADGSIRTTYATNIENAYPDCILHAGSIINKEFDRVFHLVAESLEAAAGGAEAAAAGVKQKRESPSKQFFLFILLLKIPPTLNSFFHL